ncbi:vitrin [Mycolicibacterium brisbanense]|uniref:Vitrin n=1 Tax=Mycolicibacterium brisbanense TaxID=146020 RepID=A0A100W499_9MYCO|nr:vitrin [Mycolicibacterium brisbanense]
MRRVVEFGCRPATQLHGLHQDRRSVAESRSQRGDVTDQGRARQSQLCGRGESLTTLVRPQIADIGNSERYDGLTPVTITL